LVGIVFFKDDPVDVYSLLTVHLNFDATFRWFKPVSKVLCL